jgi:serine/threonine protein kinase
MAKRVMAAPNAHAVVSPGMPGKSPQSAPKTTSRRPESSGASNGGGVANSEGRILKAANLRVFTFAELKAATRNFKSDTVLGEGGFGRVYKGWVDETTMSPARSVAVKKLNPESLQGVQEWQVRIKPFFFSGEAIFLPTF